MVEHGPGHPPARANRPHRLDLAMGGVEFLQGLATEQLTPLPGRPETDAGPAKALEVQGVDTFRRGEAVHAAKVLRQQSLYLGG